jgi:class 3 adenylate cyclase
MEADRLPVLSAMASNIRLCRSSPEPLSTRPDRGEMVSPAPPSRSLPDGTVTFAFTDVEASTHLLRRLGERYGEVLSKHRRIIRGAFRSAGGTEIDRQGDAFFFAFPRARDGVAAAVEGQRAHARATWPDGSLVRVRIGLHTGEPTMGDEGYLGIDVVMAARICKLARGGDILLSETTRALSRSRLPDGVVAIPVGQRHLKDMDAPVDVYRLAIEDLDGAPGALGTGPSGRRVQIPEAWEREIGQRFGAVGTRLVADLGERIAGSLEAIAGETSPPATGAATAGENLDVLAARAAASLEEKLRSKAAAAFRAAHLPATWG